MYRWIAILFVFYVTNCDCYRLIDHSTEDVIEQFMEESINYENLTDIYGASTTFLELCSSGHLTNPFPQYLCSLLFILSKEQYSGYKMLFNETWEAVSQLNNRSNHPCTHPLESCITVILPKDRLLVGCVNNSVDVMESVETVEDFRYDFIVPHRLPTNDRCKYDENNEPICSLQSIIVESEVLIERRSCCCKSGYCGRIIMDQDDIISPFVEITFDLKEVNMIKRRKRQAISLPETPTRGENTLTSTTTPKELHSAYTHEEKAFMGPITVCALVMIIFLIFILLKFCCRNKEKDGLGSLGVDNYTIESVHVNHQAYLAKHIRVQTPNMNGEETLR